MSVNNPDEEGCRFCEEEEEEEIIYVLSVWRPGKIKVFLTVGKGKPKSCNYLRHSFSKPLALIKKTLVDDNSK